MEIGICAIGCNNQLDLKISPKFELEVIFINLGMIYKSLVGI